MKPEIMLNIKHEQITRFGLKYKEGTLVYSRGAEFSFMTLATHACFHLLSPERNSRGYPYLIRRYWGNNFSHSFRKMKLFSL